MSTDPNKPRAQCGQASNDMDMELTQGDLDELRADQGAGDPIYHSDSDVERDLRAQPSGEPAPESDEDVGDAIQGDPRDEMIE